MSSLIPFGSKGLQYYHNGEIVKSGLKLKMPKLKDQKITYNLETEIYYLTSFIQEAELVGSLEKKIKSLSEERFGSSKTKEVTDDIKKIEDIYGKGSFEKLINIKKCSPSGSSTLSVNANNTDVYFIGDGVGFYFGDISEVPEVDNIHLIDGSNICSGLEFLRKKELINSKHFSYWNGIDFDGLLKSPEIDKMRNGNPTLYSMIMSKWTPAFRILENEKTGNITDYNLWPGEGPAETMGKFGNIITTNNVDAKRVNSFNSIITEGNIDIEISRNYSPEEKGNNIKYYNDIHKRYLGYRLSVYMMRLWGDVGQQVFANSITYPWRKWAPLEECGKIEITNSPKLISHNGNINIKCHSPRVFIAHKKMTPPRYEVPHIIYAHSNNGKVKVDYTGGML